MSIGRAAWLWNFIAMSNIALDKSISMNKATISFWVRVPSASVTACRRDAGNNYGYKVFLATIPFITWGQQQRGDLGVLPPSYIGIYVGGVGFERDPPTLEINLQTQDTSTGGHRDAMVEYFGNSAINTSILGTGYPVLKPDIWHHLLISWELKSTRAIMYCAIDGIDKSGVDQLPAMCNPDIRGPNEHDCSAVYSESLVDPADRIAVSFNLSEIPSGHFSLPAPLSVQYLSFFDTESSKNPIYIIELAELYIYSGLVLQSSDWRKFVEDGKPRDPSDVEDDVHRKPDILLHGTSDWKEGKNTGSLGVDADGNIKEDGQFKPTGKIQEYKPDPSIP